MDSLLVWILLCSSLQRALSEFKGHLEINYDFLSGDVYHPEQSNAVYGQAGTHMVLGCMLPSGTPTSVQDAERRFLMWSKGAKMEATSVICDLMHKRAGCTWEDPSPTKPRGAMLLRVLLTETEDNFRQTLAASGIYKCVHTNGDRYYQSADVQVWVAGSLLDINVSGIPRLEKRIYQLPNASANDTDKKSVFLECGVTISKGIETKFHWYRDSHAVFPTSKFVFKDPNDKRLEIKNAGGGDGGVYMCEADLQQAGKIIKARQYVILKGDHTSAALSIFDYWRNHTLKLLFLFLITSSISLSNA